MLPLAWVLVPGSFLDVLYTGLQDASVTPVWSFMCSVADAGLVSECMYHIVKAGYIPGWSFLRPGHMFRTMSALRYKGISQSVYMLVFHSGIMF